MQSKVNVGHAQPLEPARIVSARSSVRQPCCWRLTICLQPPHLLYRGYVRHQVHHDWQSVLPRTWQGQQSHWAFSRFECNRNEADQRCRVCAVCPGSEGSQRQDIEWHCSQPQRQSEYATSFFQSLPCLECSLYGDLLCSIVVANKLGSLSCVSCCNGHAAGSRHC